jgi:poly-gamma-glutamate capsule biosynthesis protein CapA/YwtB (metallophosphatase superfamily)
MFKTTAMLSCLLALAGMASARDDSTAVTVLAVGDVMVGGSMQATVQAQGPDYPFAGTAGLIRQADIAIGNLEAPFGTTGKPFKKRFTFLVPPRSATGLGNAGFDVVALANNHILDYGPEPLKHTLRLLDSLGIGHSGAGMNLDQARKPAIVARKGLKVAFLSYSRVHPTQFWATAKRPGTAPATESQVRADILEARKQADVVVASFHWGAELMDTPKCYQRDLAHLCIDAGADLVLGHHPHILQGLELYKGRLIAYSLGNFVFESRSRKCTESAMLEVAFTKAGPARARIVPLCVDNTKVIFQPTVVGGPEGKTVLAHLAALSEKLGLKFAATDSVAIITF